MVSSNEPTKLIIDPKTERVLGVGIVGAGAGELIADGTLAVEMGAVAADLKMTIHPHPTLSETVREAADVFSGESAHVYKPKKRAEGWLCGARWRDGSGCSWRAVVACASRNQAASLALKPATLLARFLRSLVAGARNHRYLQLWWAAA
jgi:hypothetical protein